MTKPRKKPIKEKAKLAIQLEDLKKLRWDLLGRQASLQTHVDNQQVKLDAWGELISGYTAMIDKLTAPEAYEVTSEQSTKRRSTFKERMMEKHGIKL